MKKGNQTVQEPLQLTGGLHAPSGPVHLLLVDDERAILELYRQYLERAVPLCTEYVATPIHLAATHDEALATARDVAERGERLGCALVDYHLGEDEDGIDTTNALWEIDPDLQCTLVTGVRELGDRETRDRIPAPFLDRWDFLSKPAAAFEIVQRVRLSLSTWFARRREEERVRENLNLVSKLAQINLELEATVQERTHALADRNRELQSKNTALKRALHDLEAAQGQLLHQEKMACIGQLAAGVAHELNNPIGFVHSNLGTLERYYDKIEKLLKAYEAAVDPGDSDLASLRKELKIDFLMEDLPSLIAESRDGTDRVRKIVTDLKVFSHPAQEELDFSDLNAGLDTTLNIVHNELKYKARVVREFGEIPLVRCRLAQLNQVFMNILVNAGQAMTDFGEIRVTTCQEDDEVVVRIADNGPGMPPETLPRIFEPFFTTKEVGDGTGLGLSISYDLVRQHGGTLMVESEMGKGATFTIRLPIEGETHAES